MKERKDCKMKKKMGNVNEEKYNEDQNSNVKEEITNRIKKNDKMNMKIRMLVKKWESGKRIMK